MAIERRALQYQFFNHGSKADLFDKLKIAIEQKLISMEMLELIPLEFWIAILDATGDCPRCMQRLADSLGYKILP